MLLFLLSAIFSHCFLDTVSLDGAWEMAYQPYEYSRDVRSLPQFRGEIVKNAIPGYWEDLFSGEGYRIHPLFHPQTFPIEGSADDISFPNIYGAFFYRRTVSLEHGGRAFLRFEGVRNQVHIWINGLFVAFRQGFSTPFEIEINDGILRKGENTIVLAVSNNPNTGYCDLVSGLTTRSVFGGTGGVNGHLDLAFPKNDFGDIYVTTAPDLKSFTVHISGSGTFDYSIDGKMSGRACGDFTLPTDGFEFWTPEKPCLHELVIKTREGEVSRKFGIRRLTAVRAGLRLNDRPIYLRGVTEHCWFPRTIHVPRDLEYYRFITSKRKELGFNFVRFHTFVPPVEYLQACDELGMLVHIESPNFVDVAEYESIIAFARSHPCAVIYCTGNETRIDNIAEAYLNEVADLVHSMSDGLFSPMSALRGMEYALFPGHDSIAATPFPHNPERFDRVGRYADLYTSYQNSASSYNAINSPLTPEIVDSWFEVYKKPRLAHEICIDGTYADLSTESGYPSDSPLLGSGLFREIRAALKNKDLLDKADIYYRNSCEWQRRCRKFCFEKVRAMKTTAGFDFLGDINTHWHTFGYSVGMMDEFYKLKPGESVQNVLRYNSAAVLLCNLGSDFVFEAGQSIDLGISISNYAKDAVNGILKLSLITEKGKRAYSITFDNLPAPLGDVSQLAELKLPIPKSREATRYFLRAEYTAGSLKAENEWELYAFPKADSVNTDGLDVVKNISKDKLLKAMAEGRTVVLLGSGPFKSLGSTFQCGLPGRSSGNTATVIKKGHHALENFPHDGFCGWQFRRMMEGAQTVQLEAGVPFDPIIDVASSVKMPIRQSFLFEYRVGPGRLLVCSLVFSEKDPASMWLRSRLLEYASSELFKPEQMLTIEQLSAIIDAPLLQGNINTNTATNIKDPSSLVRVPRSAPYSKLP